MAAQAWERAMPQPKLSADEQTSVGAKLESFGLTIKLEREAWEPPAFRPLERSEKFIEYIRTAAEKAE